MAYVRKASKTLKPNGLDGCLNYYYNNYHYTGK
jgi:hypothetical protein